MANSGLKKLIKRDPVQASAIQSVPELHGAIFNFGRIRSGKTAALMAIAQAYHDHPSRNYKVFDIWGGDRNEHLYWTLPSNKINYWAKVKKSLRLNKSGPKQYKVNLLYPVFGKIPNKLPESQFVHSKLFTIPFDDVLPEDLALISGSLSTRDEALWKDVLFDCKRKTVPEMLKFIKGRKGTSYTIYRSSIFPLTREPLFQSYNCPTNIDVKEELNDQKTISVLCLDFVDREYKLFIAGYIIRKIAESLDKRTIKTILPFREASEIFRVSDASVVPDRIKIFKSYLSQWIRMGRRGMHFLLDTQSPAETRGLVSGQQDLTLLGRLPSQADRAAATDQLFADNLITKKQIIAIGALDPGQFIVCPSGKKAYYQYFFLPKSRFWEEGCGNFYKSIWKNTVDKWTDVKEDIKVLKDKRKADELLLKEKDEIDEINEENNEGPKYFHKKNDTKVIYTNPNYKKDPFEKVEEIKIKEEAKKAPEEKVVKKEKPKKDKRRKYDPEDLDYSDLV